MPRRAPAFTRLPLCGLLGPKRPLGQPEPGAEGGFPKLLLRLLRKQAERNTTEGHWCQSYAVHRSRLAATLRGRRYFLTIRHPPLELKPFWLRAGILR